MRPGMGRGFACAGVVEAVRVMGMVVAGLGERSKNFVIGFLMRGYVGWGAWPGRRPSGTEEQVSQSNQGTIVACRCGLQRRASRDYSWTPNGG